MLYLDEEIKDYEGHRKYHGHRRVFDIATKLLKAHIAEKKLTDAERFAAAEAVAVRALLKHRATMKAERAAQQREEERLLAEVRKYRPHIGGLDKEAANSGYVVAKAKARTGMLDG